MPNPNLTETQLIIGLVAGLSGLIIFPLASALLLWLSTKIFRFRKRSFLMSLGCVLIAFGCVTAVNAVFVMLLLEQLEKYAVLFGLSTIATGITSEIIAVKMLFKESIVKSVGATLFALIIGLVLYMIVIGVTVLFFSEQIQAIFPQ